MRKIDEIAEPACRCTGHRELTPVANHSQAMQSASTRTLRFTPDMIRDQEMLVSSMSQQGISEDLIRRQFERLLEEQSKQLRFIKDEPLKDKADHEKVVETKKCSKAEADTELYNMPSGGSFVIAACNQLANPTEACKVSHCQEAANKKSQPRVTEEKSGRTHLTSNTAETGAENISPARVEPSSLLKIRLKKEALNSLRRNNGLQEAATALKIIKDSKSKIAQDRLGSEAEGLLKLNGTQERTAAQQMKFNNVIEETALHNKTENQGKIASANGLENSRNLDNPPSHRYRPHPPAVTYTATPTSTPLDKLTEFHSHSSTSASATTATPVTTADVESTTRQTNNSHNQQNTLHSELQEPKVIGGFTYFARKSRCTPKMSGVTYGISSDHSNHKISNQSSPRTTLPISH